ncbi:MAG: GyrI-like domain-containing protein [Anaerolineae bacterium]|nr:GyrI-like domain-containing protein [Anaerolineae bacterium]
MLKPQIIDLPAMVLAGFSFFGDPFHSHAGWTEENEIGRVWQRLTVFYETLPAEERHNANEAVWYELHLEHPGSIEKGEWEIFVGYQIEQPDEHALELTLKHLPAMTWAVFTLKGTQIGNFDADYKNWLAASDYEEAFPLLIERYDERFKGMERIEESELDYLVPVRKNA